MVKAKDTIELESLIGTLQNELTGMIMNGFGRKIDLFEELPEYMVKAIDVFTRPALQQAKQILKDHWCMLENREEWDELEHILCDRMQNPRFRRKLKKHRQTADALSMRCVRMLDQMIRFLKAGQRLDRGHDPDDAQKTT